jgi:hypothetical protein
MLVPTLLGGMLFVAGAGYLLLVRFTEGAPAADNDASVIAGILATAGATGAIWGWAHRHRKLAALPASAEQVEQAAATLAELVHEQWRTETQARALDDPEPMPVRWRLTTPELMDHPEVIAPGGGLTFAGSSDRIGELAAAFRALRRRRLVITGGPGSGKTTLAVQLLLELLAQSQPDDPVPVLFSLAGWDPGTHPRVQDWLTTELDECYPALRAISPDASAALAAHRLLPVLDGLDEVPPGRRAEIIGALNTSLGTGGLILTSRRPEYRAALTDAGDVLTGAATIGPYALTPAEAAAYLDKYLPPGRDPAWDPVLAALTTGTAAPLAAVTATPLGLWLVRAVIIDDHRPPTVLTDTSQFPSAAALRAYLLDELIPATVRARPPLSRRRRDAPEPPLRPTRWHHPDDLRRWLTTLAEQLRSSGTQDWLWWQLARRTFPTRRSRLWLFPAFGLVGALLAWPLIELEPLPLLIALGCALVVTTNWAPRPAARLPTVVGTHP